MTQQGVCLSKDKPYWTSWEAYHSATATTMHWTTTTIKLDCKYQCSWNWFGWSTLLGKEQGIGQVRMSFNRLFQESLFGYCTKNLHNTHKAWITILLHYLTIHYTINTISNLGLIESLTKQTNLKLPFTTETLKSSKILCLQTQSSYPRVEEEVNTLVQESLIGTVTKTEVLKELVCKLDQFIHPLVFFLVIWYLQHTETNAINFYAK